MMERVLLSELASVLVEKSGLKKKVAEQFVTVMFDVIKTGIEQDQQVKVKGLGTFKVIDVEPRASVDVNTGERVLINGHRKITFTPDATMKELVNKPFSQFETVILNDGIDFEDIKEEKEDLDADEDETSVQDLPEEEPVVELTPVVGESTPVVEEPMPAVEEPMPAVEEPTPIVEKPTSVVEEPIPVVVEEIVPSDGESEVTSEPLIEFFSSSEDEEGVLTEDVPIDKTENAPTDEQEAETEGEAEEQYEEESGHSGWIWRTVGIALLACLIGFGAGYYVAKQFGTTSTETAKRVAKPAPAEPDKIAEKAKPAEPVKPVEPVRPVESVKPMEPAKPAEAVEPAEPAKPAAVETLAPDKYEQMDARVRTGAYRIVGTAETVKVRAGDDVKKIAKRTLGPDMECYIEVYNGITASTPLEAGKEIKIPKIELKKKKKKTENQ